MVHPEGPRQAQAVELWAGGQGSSGTCQTKAPAFPRNALPCSGLPHPVPANPHLSSLCQEAASEDPRPVLTRSTSSDTSEEVSGWADRWH